MISFLQDITNTREGWCGDHGVYTPQLTSKRVRYLLKSLQDLPPNEAIATDSLKTGIVEGVAYTMEYVDAETVVFTRCR